MPIRRSLLSRVRGGKEVHVYSEINANMLEGVSLHRPLASVRKLGVTNRRKFI